MTTHESNSLDGAGTSDLWNGTYASKKEAERSWSEDVPHVSLSFIDEAHLTPSAPIIDVGGGSSRLVDQLLAGGHSDVTVLDISAAAIDEARHRVEDERAKWIVADVTTWVPARSYALWHDRAVFHFLVSSADQACYVATAMRSVQAGGYLVLATFSHAGPATCSGLAVQRWSSRELTELFDDGFSLVESAERDHVTPWGAVQPFSWVMLRRRSS
jgi:SAM-dependent methyltransferase